MNREYRRVPLDWQHPKDARGNYVPLLSGDLAQILARWDAHAAKWDAGLSEDVHRDNVFVPIAPEYQSFSYAEYAGDRPEASSYMPQWSPEVATGYQQYETVTEGTPVSPVFATDRLLAKWMMKEYGDDFTFEDRLESIREDFHNPDADRRSLLNVNLAPKLAKGTYLVERPGDEAGGPWKLIGWNQPPPRKALIERLMPLMDEVPPTTLDHAKMLYQGDTGALSAFMEELIGIGRVTVAEYLDFLSRTRNGKPTV
jgi:hypothetical protein